MLGLLYLAEKGFKKAFSAKYKRIIGGMWVKKCIFRQLYRLVSLIVGSCCQYVFLSDERLYCFVNNCKNGRFFTHIS